MLIKRVRGMCFLVRHGKQYAAPLGVGRCGCTRHSVGQHHGGQASDRVSPYMCFTLPVLHCTLFETHFKHTAKILPTCQNCRIALSHYFSHMCVLSSVAITSHIYSFVDDIIISGSILLVS